jgi:hypothetical protein
VRSKKNLSQALAHEATGASAALVAGLPLGGGHPPSKAGAADVARLEAERQDLLRSGVYKQSDPLVLELTRQIAQIKRSIAIETGRGVA